MTLARGPRARGAGRAGGVRGRRARRRALRRRRGPRRRRRGRLGAPPRPGAPHRRVGSARRWPTSSQERPASSDGAWSSGCSSSARARSTCSCARAPPAALDDLIERWSIVVGASAAASASSRCIGDLRRPLLGVEKEQVAELRGKIDALLPPRRRLRHDRAGRAQHGGQRRRHHARGRTGARARRQAPAPRLLDRRRRAPTRACSTEDMFDEGQRLPSPYHRTKFESERIVREQPYVPWRVYRPGDRRRRLADRRDGQDRRPLLLLQGDPADAPAAARVGAAGRASTSATRTSCRSTGSPARSSTSPTSPTSTAGPST